MVEGFFLIAALITVTDIIFGFICLSLNLFNRRIIKTLKANLPEQFFFFQELVAVSSFQSLEVIGQFIRLERQFFFRKESFESDKKRVADSHDTNNNERNNKMFLL